MLWLCLWLGLLLFVCRQRRASCRWVWALPRRYERCVPFTEEQPRWGRRSAQPEKLMCLGCCCFPQVPADWHAWLHHVTDRVPSQMTRSGPAARPVGARPRGRRRARQAVPAVDDLECPGRGRARARFAGRKPALSIKCDADPRPARVPR